MSGQQSGNAFSGAMRDAASQEDRMEGESQEARRTPWETEINKNWINLLISSGELGAAAGQQ